MFLWHDCIVRGVESVNYLEWKKGVKTYIKPLKKDIEGKQLKVADDHTLLPMILFSHCKDKTFDWKYVLTKLLIYQELKYELFKDKFESFLKECDHVIKSSVTLLNQDSYKNMFERLKQILYGTNAWFILNEKNFDFEEGSDDDEDEYNGPTFQPTNYMLHFFKFKNIKTDNFCDKQYVLCLH